MNIDDRAEMLGGRQQHAPAEIFAGVWGLAGSVLPSADYREHGVPPGTVLTQHSESEESLLRPGRHQSVKQRWATELEQTP
jgi:hypothetical protein